VQLAWDNTPWNELGFKLERSTDGLAFTPLAALGANQTNYTDNSLPAGRTWYYRIRAWNEVGDSPYSDIAIAGETNAPAIGASPQDYVAALGATATFSVIASGMDPLTYQWQANGIAIEGQTSSQLTLPNVHTDLALLDYTVVVSNPLGIATSAPPARLTVIVPPPILLDGATLNFMAQTGAGVTNVVEYKRELNDLEPWKTWTNITSGGFQSIPLPIDPEQSTRFYRVRITLP
jgi:hypothetical protein